jgi:hypothetical protein
MKLRRIFKAVVGLACLMGCSHKVTTDFGGKFIEEPGTFACFDGRLVVTVVREKGGLNYTVGNRKASAGPSKAPIKESAAWVIFPEKPRRVWIYDGEQDVTLLEIDEGGGSTFTSSQVVPAVLDAAPVAFLRQLPADFPREPSEKD